MADGAAPKRSSTAADLRAGVEDDEDEERWFPDYPLPYLAPIDRSRLCSVQEINPYLRSPTIKVRVDRRTPLQHFTTPQAEPGVFFALTLSDASDANYIHPPPAIRAVAFGEQARTLFHLFRPGRVLFVSQADIAMANPRFSEGLTSSYELRLSRRVLVEPADDDVPPHALSFKRARTQRAADREQSAYALPLDSPHCAAVDALVKQGAPLPPSPTHRIPQRRSVWRCSSS